MTNSDVAVFLGLYDAILTDCEAAYPGLTKEFRRDKQRLETTASARGMHLFTIDLPAIGRFFESCLEHRHIPDHRRFVYVRERSVFDGEERMAVKQVPDVLPMAGRRPKSLIPRLFGGLWARVFDDQGLELPCADEAAVLYLRQLFYAAKKVKFDCPPSATFKAVAEFVSIEKEMRIPSCDWDGVVVDTRTDIAFTDDVDSGPLPLLNEVPSSNPSNDLRSVLKTVQHICDVVASQYGEFDPLEWQGKHGPGVTSDTKGSKYEFQNWPLKLESVFSFSDYAFVNHWFWGEWALGNYERKVSEHEPPSRLIAVPKTQKGPRLIAAEPLAHQWCQQALRAYLERRTAFTSLRNSIHFGEQEFSRERAISASRTGRYATVDLSSASDRLSLWTVERCFRANPKLLGAFHAVRTRWIVNTVDKKQPKFLKLRKFATQGSAVTFPTQTVVYSMVALGVVAHLRGRYTGNPSRYSAYLSHLGEEVTVFGDDIIVPSDSYRLLVEVLQHLGLKVNPDKSFSEGNFRESCGMDAYRGVDVTPAYVTTLVNPKSPGSISGFVECSNNFFRKGFWHTADWMRSHLGSRFKLELPVVSTASGLFGWASFVGNDFSRLRRRWNHQLQREEYSVHESFARVTKGPQSEESSLFQYFTEKPSPEARWARGWVERVADKIRLRWSPLLD